MLLTPGSRNDNDSAIKADLRNDDDSAIKTTNYEFERIYKLLMYFVFILFLVFIRCQSENENQNE